MFQLDLVKMSIVKISFWIVGFIVKINKHAIWVPNPSRGPKCPPSFSLGIFQYIVIKLLKFRGITFTIPLCPQLSRGSERSDKMPSKWRHVLCCLVETGFPGSVVSHFQNSVCFREQCFKTKKCVKLNRLQSCNPVFSTFLIIIPKRNKFHVWYKIPYEQKNVNI